MSTLTLEAFSKSARLALEGICVQEKELTLLDEKGPSFDFYNDGGVDSLDMLDVAFYMERDLGIKLALEALIHSEDQMTLQNLYKSIR